MPRAAVEICRQRLTPAHFNRAVILAEVFGPDAAVTAGFLDRLTDADDVVPAAVEAARALAALDRRAHAETKLRARAESLSALVAAFAADDVDLSTMVDAAGRA
jgi:enoyl-CoA hydratase